MKLRLILLVIAVLVIAWIVWDHNRKNIKANKYVGKPSLKDAIVNYFANISFSKQKKNRKLSSYSSRNSESADDDMDMEFTDFDTEYELAKNFDGFEVISKDRKNARPIEDDEFDNYSPSTVYPDYREIRTRADRVPKYTPTAPEQHRRPEMFLVTLHIKALNNKKIHGDVLLQALISVGCRFGEMSIFHRHEKTSGQGKILFSVASMIKPGTFDIDNMQSFSTPGITLFFSAPNDNFNPLIVYDVMLKTAYKLAKLLDAEILDDERHLLSNDKVEDIKAILEQYVEEEV